MEILIFNGQKPAWDELVGDGNFSQSFAFGEIQMAEGFKVMRFIGKENGQIIDLASVIFKGIYAYIPYGPRSNKFLLELVRHEAFRGLVFVRLEPLFLPEGMRKTIPIQPERTLVLDLSLGKDQLFKAFKSKTRYNILLAQRKGLSVKIGKEYLSDFIRLLGLTSDRDAFKIHSALHYKKLLEVPEVKLAVVDFNGQIIAGGIFSEFGKTITYLHGASDYHYRNLMAPYLLHWQMIQTAIISGFKVYDFYGIDERKWPGVTRFKLGFGGQEKSYDGTYDLIISPLKYYLYIILRYLRRLI